MAKRLELGISVGIAGYSVGLSATYAALALHLQSQGHSAFDVALNAAASPLGMVLCAALLPRISRGPAHKWLLASAFVSAGALVLCALLPTFWVLWLLRFVLGLSTNVMFVVGESSLMTIAERSAVGKTMALYNALVTLGYACGPLLVLSGIGHAGTLAAASAIMLGLSAPALLSPELRQIDLSPSRDKVALSRLSWLARLLPLILATAAVAIFDNGALSFFPTSAIALGYGERVGASLASAALVGAVVIQIPAGILADRYRKASVLSAFAAAAFLSCSAIYTFALAEAALLLAAFTAGAAAFGLYTVVLASVAEQFSKDLLVTANSMLALAWGLGSLMGVPTVGAVMDALGSKYVGVALASLFAVALILFWRRSDSKQELA
ncbi:MFS transporter [Roseateles sp.]|uniref:MFS transporter n=1 Tax=Roseateles sp. TaxID=1971397 RepID=UPI0031E01596